MKIKYIYYFVILLLIGAFLIHRPMPVFAFQVEPLPEGNLVINPWFRSLANPSLSGLDGWTDAGGLNKYWSTSQKESNPSPDIVISGACGNEPVYCGTSARLSTTPGKTGGIGEVGVDAFLYQVVAATSENRKLIFFAHWVSHQINPAEVTIYGGNASTGPWTQVWIPFHQIIETETLPPPDEDTSALWMSMTVTTPPLETILPAGYPYYKMEIHARLTDGTTGFKMTGVYFTAVPALATPTLTSTNTPTPSEGGRTRPYPTPTPGNSPTPTLTPTLLPSPTPTLGTSPTPTTTATLLKSPTSTLTATILMSPTQTTTLSPSPTPTQSPGTSPSPLRTKMPSATPTKTR